MPLADRLEITQIHAAPEGEIRFPAIDPAVWRQSARESHSAGPEDDAAYDFVTYGRISQRDPTSHIIDIQPKRGTLPE
jgi:dihydrofolate reductase